ncbi:TerB family tellurite resistance protein [Bacteriovoracaceae bacterium]|nr:TerB family tellurite resistance protein [Bacteriovoracaceae bacterium]
MGWKFFQNNEEVSQHLTNLFTQEFPEFEEILLDHIASLVGLMSRVAFADSDFSTSEQDFIKKNLKVFFELDETVINKIIDITKTEYQNFLGIDNQLMTKFFKQHYSAEKRNQLLEFLFTLGAIDSRVDQSESEELRLITQGLDLTPQHFLAARAKVKEHIAALKKN